MIKLLTTALFTGLALVCAACTHSQTSPSESNKEAAEAANNAALGVKAASMNVGTEATGDRASADVRQSGRSDKPEPSNR